MKLKRIIFIFTILILVCGLLEGCSISAGSEDTSTALYTVGGRSISLGQAYMLVMSQKEFTEGTYGSGIWDVSIEGSGFGDFLQDRLKSHIALIYTGAALAESLGCSLSSDEKTLVNSAAAYYYSGLSTQLADSLDLKSDSIAEVFTAYRLAANGHDALLGDADIEVSRDEARVVVLAQIRVYTGGLSEAEKQVKYNSLYEALSRINGGEDFINVASVYNEAEKIQITVSRDDLTKAAEEAAFSLNQGGVSGIGEDEEGYFIYKCLSSSEETLSDARREKLLAEARQEYYIEYLKSYLSENPPEWHEDVWEQVSIDSVTYSTVYDFYSVYDMFFPEL